MWFTGTHRLVIEQGYAQWVRTALPHEGGLGDQDNRLLETLELLQGVHNAIAHEQMAEVARRRDTETWRKNRRNE